MPVCCEPDSSGALIEGEGKSLAPAGRKGHFTLASLTKLLLLFSQFFAATEHAEQDFRMSGHENKTKQNKKCISPDLIFSGAFSVLSTRTQWFHLATLPFRACFAVCANFPFSPSWSRMPIISFQGFVLQSGNAEKPHVPISFLCPGRVCRHVAAALRNRTAFALLRPQLLLPEWVPCPWAAPCPQNHI